MFSYECMQLSYFILSCHRCTHEFFFITILILYRVSVFQLNKAKKEKETTKFFVYREFHKLKCLYVSFLVYCCNITIFTCRLYARCTQYFFFGFSKKKITNNIVFCIHYSTYTIHLVLFTFFSFYSLV